MAVRILSNDLVNADLEALIQPGSDASGRLVPVSQIDRGNNGVTGLAGSLQVAAIPVPGIMALDVCWQTGDEDVLMCDEVPSQNINIQFQVGGEVEARFKGLGHSLNMAPGRHNLIFAPEPGDETRVARNTTLRMLHISIERQHFAALIGDDNAWCGRVLRELDADRPFSAIHGTGSMSPAMIQLVQAIRTPGSAEGNPLRRLQQHARLLDLLALQFGQFATTGALRSTGRPLSVEDAERLHKLKAYLDNNFLEEHSLAALAQQFLLNEFKLKAGFRQLFGNSVFGHLKELRMGHAAMLLRDCRQTVGEVAFTLGYEHAHHFSTAFKKQYGNTPGQWAAAARATGPVLFHH